MVTGRHRRRDDPPGRLDPHPDRLGAHRQSPLRRDLVPAPELLRRLHPDHPEETR